MISTSYFLSLFFDTIVCFFFLSFRDLYGNSIEYIDTEAFTGMEKLKEL